MIHFRSKYNKKRCKLYGKISLIRPGRIYGQKTNLMNLCLGDGGLGWWGRLIYNRKYIWGLYTPVYNLIKLRFFLFLPVEHVFWHFSNCAKCEICSKLTIKTPEYVKLTIKLKTKTSLMLFWPLYC